MDSESEGRSEFGPLEIDVQRSELLVDGIAVELGSRAFDIARLLVQAGGELLTKDEIMRRVWRSTTVEENNIQVAVSGLRKALGVHAPIIRTVAGRGYRLVVAPTSKAGNLSAPASALIGREGVLRELSRLLAGHRVVTLTGAGGIGKTSLALEAARQELLHFPDGLWVADLAPLTSGAAVPHAVASALGLEIPDSLAQASRVASLVASRKLLLVLDNCEHVIDAAAELVFAMVRVNPHVHILATSREPLGVEAETLYRVPPLAVPSGQSTETADILKAAAVQLFVARARTIKPGCAIDAAGMATIAATCRRLDGIPLAIEIAATRSAMVGLNEIARRLDDQFRDLTGGFRAALPRHRTLNATFDWSFDLLNEAERSGLCRIALSVGRFSLDMAEALLGGEGAPAEVVAETMTGLVAKSLVVPELVDGEMRYRLLQTVRSYALAKLKEAGEFDEAARRHAAYCLRILARAETDWEGRARPETLDGVEEIENPLGNAKAAIDWAFSAGGDVALGLSLTAAAVPLWMHLSMVLECRQYVERALGLFAQVRNPDPTMEMKLVAAHGMALLSTVNGGPEPRRAFERALTLAERLDNEPSRLRALWGLCTAHINDGDFRRGRELGERLYRHALASGDSDAVVAADLLYGGILLVLGDMRTARSHIERILQTPETAVARPAANQFLFNRRILARAFLGAIVWHLGEADEAMRMLKTSVDEALEEKHVISLCVILANWVCIGMLFTGRLDDAEYYARMLDDYASRHELDFWRLPARLHMAVIAVRRGQVECGLPVLRELLGDAVGPLNHPRFMRFHLFFIEALIRAGEFDEALAVVDSALKTVKQKDQLFLIPELLRSKADVLACYSDDAKRVEADRLLEQALELSRKQGSLAAQLETAISLVRLWRGRDRAAQSLCVLAQVYEQFDQGFGTADLLTARALLADPAVPSATTPLAGGQSRLPQPPDG